MFTLYDILPIYLLPYLASFGFAVAVGVGRTLAQYSHYRRASSVPSCPLPIIGHARKHQTDLLTDWGLALFAILAGAPVLVVAGLSLILWRIVQVGIQRAQGKPYFYAGEPQTWRVTIFGRTFDVHKNTDWRAYVQMGFGAAIVVVALVWQPVARVVEGVF